MRRLRAQHALLVIALLGLGSAARAAPADLDAAFAGLAAYDHGKPRDPLFAIESAIAQSSNDPAQRGRIVSRLIAALGDARMSKAARQFLCRQFERIGTEAHVPLLAKLLDDAEAMEFARRALEQIPGNAASAALRAALPRHKGTALVGLIDALGERRDPTAVEALTTRLGDKDAMVAAAAARALGKIGTQEAADKLLAVAKDPAGGLHGEASVALLRCADRVAASGKGEAAAAIYERMTTEKSPRLRAAGMVGLAKTRREKAIPLLLDALAGKDARLQGTAARLLMTLPAEAVGPALAARVPKLDARGQTLAIEILEQAGGAEARKAITALASSKDEAVSAAATLALARLGDASTVAQLARTAAEGEGAVQDAARDGLLRLRGPDVDAAILAGAAKGDWRTRVELLDAAVARRIPNAVPTLMKAAAHGHHAVRLAAFKGLRELAGAEHYPALVKLLVAAPTVADIQAAQKAVLAAGKQVEALDAKVEPILAAMEGVRPEVHVALLQALARWGGPKALEAVRAGVKDRNPRVQDAAVRALANWEDPAVMQDLQRLAASSDNKTHAILALRGLVRLAAAGKSVDESVRILEQVRDVAKSPEGKRLLLAAAADIQAPRALAFVASFVGDPDVADEARLATFALARALKKEHPQAVEATLKQVLAQRKDPDAIRQANILLGRTKFEPLFDGKSLKGWTKPFDWGQVTIEDGAIHLSGNKKFFLVTERTFGDFILEAEAWLDEGANSGIQYRSHFKKNSLWGYQADVDSLPRGWRGIYDETPGRGWLARGDAEKAETLYKKGWNRYRIECIGDRTRFFINGELIVDHLDPMEIEGHIALQHHGEKGKVVRYRNLRIMDLGTRRWLPLIDERSMAKWESNGVGQWSIKDGVIDGRKSGDGHGMLYSPRPYGDFCLRFKVKAVAGNAGFYIRSEKLPGVQGARGLAVEIDPAKDQAGGPGRPLRDPRPQVGRQARPGRPQEALPQRRLERDGRLRARRPHPRLPQRPQDPRAPRRPRPPRGLPRPRPSRRRRPHPVQRPRHPQRLSSHLASCSGMGQALGHAAPGREPGRRVELPLCGGLSACAPPGQQAEAET